MIVWCLLVVDLNTLPVFERDGFDEASPLKIENCLTTVDSPDLPFSIGEFFPHILKQYEHFYRQKQRVGLESGHINHRNL